MRWYTFTCDFFTLYIHLFSLAGLECINKRRKIIGLLFFVYMCASCKQVHARIPTKSQHCARARLRSIDARCRRRCSVVDFLCRI